MRSTKGEKKEESKGLAGRKEKRKEGKETPKRKEKVYTPSVRKYFKKVEKPRIFKYLESECGWGEQESKYQDTSMGVGSSQNTESCANSVAPNLTESSQLYQIKKLGENRQQFVYDGVAAECECTQYVNTMHQGGAGDTAETTVQNSCNGCLAGKTD